jgi:lactate dehydrogenase-like 2-hydroxyacid dehydrogenase
VCHGRFDKTYFLLNLAEVTGSNVVSVAEHVVMQILALVRNFIPAYKVGYNDLLKHTEKRICVT